MADIFISYAREDRETVAKLAAALEGAGHSVWWDRHVVGGAEFSAEIERELAAAKAAIVAWSAHGNASHWVKDEAALARDAGKLVPISLDGIEPPIGFRQFHALDFTGWRGDAAAPKMAALEQSVAQKIGAGSAEPAGARAAASPAPRVPSLWQIPAARLSLIAAVALTALAAVAVALWRPWETGRSAEKTALPTEADGSRPAQALPEKSIAVLPFKNFSPNKENEYFADGLTEELLNRLANVGGLKVTSRTSSFTFKDKNVPLPEIAKQLGVRHILEGSVRRDGDDLRVTAQLIDVLTDTHLWSENFDRKIEKIFALQDEIAGRVTEALKVALIGADNKPLAPLPTTSVELYADFLKARENLSTFQFEPMKAAETSLRRIVAADPEFVPAATTLIGLLLRMGETGIYSASEAFARAKLLVDQVLAKDKRNADAWLARAYIEAYEGRRFGAEQARERAQSLAPNNVSVLQDRILQDYWARKPKGAEEPIAQLIALDPLSMFTYVPAAFWYNRTGNEDRYRVAIGRMSELFPGTPVAQFMPLITPSAGETNAHIVQAGLRGYAVERTDPDVPSLLAFHFLDAGRPDEAQRYAREAQALDPEHDLGEGASALVKLYDGDEAGALKIAEKIGRAEASTRWGSRDLALRILAARALAKNDRGAMRRLVASYLSIYPELERGDLASRFMFPALYVKWGHFMAALDLAAIYESQGETAKANTLQDSVESELSYWPERGIFGSGFADAELKAMRGEAAAALEALKQAARDSLTENWWFFLDHSPHFARLRKLPEFASLRADFAARAAIPDSVDTSPPEPH